MAEGGGTYFLQYVKIDRFGSTNHRVVGPIGPHLNIVYGPNEAGKTTVASFIKGVLFGWGKSRESRNTYKPSNGERSGALVYASREDEPSLTLSRLGDAGELSGAAPVMADIDQETFYSMFCLNNDELMALRDTTDATAKILAAGSGTGSSPNDALSTINDRIEDLTSPSSEAENSIPRLTAEKEVLREKKQQAAEQADLLRRQDAELRALETQREDMAQRVEKANRLVERLSAASSTLQRIDDEIAKLKREKERLELSVEEMRAQEGVLEGQIGHRLAKLSANGERHLRNNIEHLVDNQQQKAHSCDIARTNYASSKAVYEALLETTDEQTQQQNEKLKHSIQIAFSIIVPIMLLLLGVPLFVRGFETGSLTYLSLGIMFILFGVFMVASAFVMLFRPDKHDAARKERLENAHWVMIQDKKKLEACFVEEQQVHRNTVAQLEDMGLADAEGSCRQALLILDNAREVRAEIASCKQRRQAAASRVSQACCRQEELAGERISCLKRAEMPQDASLADVQEELESRERQRAGLVDAFEEMNCRVGELRAILDSARDDHEFDYDKIEYQQMVTRLDEATQELERLLVAKRMLQSSLATWESDRQPEVYRKASDILSLMTNGRWREVSLDDTGMLQVSSGAEEKLPPALLSLGTRQQLYLSLRIAYLLNAENTGRCVPVLADDILVNFDEFRRKAAAQALCVLAEKRQVILFTCHKEVVDVLKEAALQKDWQAVVMELKVHRQVC